VLADGGRFLGYSPECRRSTRLMVTEANAPPNSDVDLKKSDEAIIDYAMNLLDGVSSGEELF